MGCEILDGLGLNFGDFYFGLGSIVVIEGVVSFFFFEYLMIFVSWDLM